MLSSLDFVRQSLETHLLFARIMKEHSFFLEIGFTSRDIGFMQRADEFRREFDRLLAQVVSLANGIVSQDILRSEEVVTQYTLQAERVSAYYTGIRIPTELTEAETNLMGGNLMAVNPVIEQRVYSINQRAIELTTALIQFKTTILSNVLSCRMLTVNYPLLIDHIMREAKLYLRTVQRLQTRQDMNVDQETLEQEAFWNRIMGEHAKFVRGLLDPTENDLINTANDFGNEFDKLTADAMKAMEGTIPQKTVTEESLKATMAIRNFKASGTQGLLQCKIKSIVTPLLGDHILREANHYLRLLKKLGR